MNAIQSQTGTFVVNHQVFSAVSISSGLWTRFAQIPGVTFLKPSGTFYSFPDFSAVYNKTWKGEPIGGSLRFAQYLLEEAKVAVVPGAAFGADKNARLSFATSMDNLSRGLDRIAEAIDSLK